MILLYLLLGFFVIYVVLLNLEPDPWWWSLGRDVRRAQADQDVKAVTEHVKLHAADIIAALRRGETYDITVRGGRTYTIALEENSTLSATGKDAI